MNVEFGPSLTLLLNNAHTAHESDIPSNVVKENKSWKMCRNVHLFQCCCSFSHTMSIEFDGFLPKTRVVHVPLPFTC